MKTTKIWLIRHGETNWNTERRIQGHVDIPLNQAGILQAKQVAKRLRTESFAACYSSDLQRARITAEHIAKHHGLDVKVHSMLRERSYGKLEGMTKAEIDQLYPDYQARNHANLEQESLEDVRTRAKQILTQIVQQHQGQAVAVVSHGGFINSVLYMLSDGTVGTGITHLKNTSISTIIYEGGQWKIDLIGEAEHLTSNSPVESCTNAKNAL